MHYHCLIVDDDEILAESTSDYFNLSDIKTHYVTSAKDSLTFLEENTVDVLLLDVNLEQESGFTLCQKIREQYTMPILFISARNSYDDILLGLSIGGDDYVTKPYSLSVLLAKVKIMLKRFCATTKAESPCPIRIDKKAAKVYRNDTYVPLREKEYRLLAYLMQEKGRIIPKEELFEKVWENSFTGDGTLNVHIRHLREKLEEDPNNPKWIQTVWGRGYTFSSDNETLSSHAENEECK